MATRTLSRTSGRYERKSYDDEAWFGDDYECAYAHTPENSTKSILYLITGGRVTGIELVISN